MDGRDASAAGGGASEASGSALSRASITAAGGEALIASIGSPEKVVSSRGASEASPSEQPAIAAARTASASARAIMRANGRKGEGVLRCVGLRADVRGIRATCR